MDKPSLIRRAFSALKSWERSITGVDVFGAAWDDGNPFPVTGDKALKLIPFYAATGLIADSLAGLDNYFTGPLAGGDLRHRIRGPEWMDETSPDPQVSLYDWWHQGVASALVRGNAVGLALPHSGGGWAGLRWLHPQSVNLDESGTHPVYRFGGSSKPHTSVQVGGDIVHIRGYLMPGSVWGLSPVGQFRRQLGMAANLVRWGDEFYENGVVPAGILKNGKTSLTTTQTNEAKRLFMASVRNGEPVALDENWSWESVKLSAQDAQFLTALKDVATSIGTMFRLDPEDVGGTTGSSLRYSTVEGNQRKLNVRTLLPWTKRFERGLQPLWPRGERMHFDLDALARPNFLERVRGEDVELRNGTLLQDEARVAKGRAPLTPAQKREWFATYGGGRGNADAVAALADLLDPNQKEGD